MRLKSRYTNNEFKELLSAETEQIELKTGLGNDPLQEALVALSNANGGVILIGVRDDGSVAGKSRDQGIDDKIHEIAMSARDIGRYHISEIGVAGTPIVAIRLERRVGGFAQTSSGRILVRRGRRNIALFGAELTRFINERSLTRFETTDTHVDLSDADQDLIQEMAKAFLWEVGEDVILARLQEQRLVTPGGTLTLTGALFLTQPGQALRQHKYLVEVRRYPAESSVYDRREEFAGPLHHQVAEATRFLVEELGKDIVFTGVYRHELSRLPEVVIRESIANAVAHRSYEQQGTSTIVDMFSDQIVVTSPGGLPEPVTVENLRQAQVARNHDILSVLRRYRLAEDAGRGIDVIQDSMAEALLNPPEFEDSGHSVTVRLPLEGPITAQERGWVTDLERRGKIRGVDRLLLVHAARGERLTNAAAREILRVGRAEARQALQRLRDERLLEQEGERRGASYSIAEEIAPPAAFRMSPNALARLVMNEAVKRPLSNSDVREITGLPRQEALTLLNFMVRRGMLRRRGEKRGTRYVVRASR